MKKTIPVILDTDIGTDIDDSWALVMLLNSPELDLKLVTTATFNTDHRTAITAKMLQAANRTDIPIGTGINTLDKPLQVSPWVKDFDITKYKGKIYSDGVDAMIKTIMDSKEKTTLISIGPVTNIAEALRREPRIAAKTKFVGMQGSIAKNYAGAPGIVPEYNVIVDVISAISVFSAPWDSMTITPIDTCGVVRLDGDLYRRVKESLNPLTKALIDSYQLWLGGRNDEGKSSILFDTVAVYLAFAEDLLEISERPVEISWDGCTRVNEKGKKIRWALEWKSLESFREFLVTRLV
ncbi:MAG: nucleoside hydrolase [Victivallales bacterium]|jgi:inosine-uridine nucleoside N-ribohydrolase